MSDELAMPAPELATDAVLGEVRKAVGRNRMLCVAATTPATLRHFRPSAGGPANMLYTVAPTAKELANAPFHAGDTVWGGLYSKEHFGHMAAETVHRLWAVALLPELAHATVAFQVSAGRDGDIAPWFAELLARFSVAQERVKLVNRVTRFERLHVPMQGRTLGGIDLTPCYGRVLSSLPLAKAPADTPRRIYVSRRAHIHTGKYLGESHVEALLRAHGFTILVPENEPLEQVLAKLAAAELIVFVEGSAIHNLDLMGRVKARIFVIGRRSGTRGRFAGVLAAACDEWAIFSECQDSVGLDWISQMDTVHGGRTCSFVDLPLLVHELSRFLRLDLTVPDAAAARRATAWDLLRFVMDERTGAYNRSDAVVGRALGVMRRSPAVRALLAEAEDAG